MFSTLKLSEWKSLLLDGIDKRKNFVSCKPFGPNLEDFLIKSCWKWRLNIAGIALRSPSYPISYSLSLIFDVLCTYCVKIITIWKQNAIITKLCVWCLFTRNGNKDWFNRVLGMVPPRMHYSTSAKDSKSNLWSEWRPNLLLSYFS